MNSKLSEDTTKITLYEQPIKMIIQRSHNCVPYALFLISSSVANGFE